VEKHGGRLVKSTGDGQWLSEVETRIERIRAAARGEGQPLTKLNALGLAARWSARVVALVAHGLTGVSERRRGRHRGP